VHGLATATGEVTDAFERSRRDAGKPHPQTKVKDMTPPDINNDSRPRRFRLPAAVAALALTGVVAALPAYASGGGKVNGVRAAVKHGTLNVRGSDGGQQVGLRLNGAGNQIQVDAGNDGSADFSFAAGDVDAIKVKMGDGHDLARIDDSNGAFTGNSRPTTIAGGDGNDTLLGAQNPPAGPADNQVETYKGGDGNDTIDGGRGNDTAYLGAGNDTFRWDPGEGSDVIEGQDGTDTLLFNGAPGTDNVTLSPKLNDAGRLDFFRVQGTIHMDTNDVETVDFNALAGTDTVQVDDLTGTDVTQTNVDLASALGGAAPDGVVDSVDVNGTNGVDNVSIQGNGSGADVTGLATAVSVKHADPVSSATPDHLNVHTRDGVDNVVQNVGGLIQLLVD
jgi:Ca2+-binding RTX toxin-like protein